MKITKQELKQIIKEEVDFLLRETQFELGSKEGAVGKTGGGGSFPTGRRTWNMFQQGIVPPVPHTYGSQDSSLRSSLAAIRAGRPSSLSGWKIPPVSRPGGAPIQHPGVATPRIEPITGQETGGLDIERPADPYEAPGAFPLPTERPVPKRDDLSSLEAAIMQALMQRLG